MVIIHAIIKDGLVEEEEEGMENWVSFEDEDKDEGKGETTSSSSSSSSSISDFHLTSHHRNNAHVAKESEEFKFLRKSIRSRAESQRSQSTDSSRSDSRGISHSNNFYTHPSPKPHLPTRREENGRRRNTKMPPPAVGIFPIGLIRTLGIEMGSQQKCRKLKLEKKKKEETKEKNGFGFWSAGYGDCKCSSVDVVLESITCCASSIDLVQ